MIARIDTLLVDLEGTLVRVRRGGLRLAIARLVRKRFKGAAPVWRLYPAAMAALRAMRENETSAPNLEVLVKTFAEQARMPEEVASSRLAVLAEEDFATLSRFFTPIPRAREAFVLARKLDFNLVLAADGTDLLETVRHRLGWAGVADLPWAFIAHAGVLARSGATPDACRELLRAIGKPPEACLLVTSSPEKELAAREIGLATFLVAPDAEPQRDVDSLARYNPTFEGSFENLYRLLMWAYQQRDAHPLPPGPLGLGA